ncbi:MAG: TonB-dependent receptor [Candidatus Krumholzibacteriia bacterium]|nr:TonB-dependent receptor [Candidatus Latescibacterota bacterium]
MLSSACRPLRAALFVSLLLLCAVLAAGPAVAQGGGATVTGTLLDAVSGKPLPYGNVVLLGTQFGAMTLDDGTFLITQIPPGTYTVRASYMGYKMDERTLVRLRNGTVLELEFTLEPTVIKSETITVFGEKPLVDVTEASSTKSLAADEIAKMPVETVAEVVVTQPGVVQQDDEIHIRGGRSDETLILVDGVPMKDALAGTSSAKGIDSKSVSDMDLITGGWRAEYGDAMAGVINVTLKEGGQTFSGFAEYGIDHLPGVATDWEHYFTDTYKFQLSGPLPGSGTWFPGERLSFFANFSGEIMDTRFPNIRDMPGGGDRLRIDYEDSFLGFPITWSSSNAAPRQNNAWNGTLKLAWKVNRDHKLTLTMTKYLAMDQGFDRHDISDLTRDSNSYPYQWSRYLDHYSAFVEDRNTAVLNYRQSFGSSMFQEVQLSRFYVRLHQDSQKPAADTLRDYLAEYAPQALNWPDPAQGDDWIFHPYFYLNGDYNQYRDRYVERWSGKWSLTKKWYPNHKGKAGFGVDYETIQNVEIRDPWIQRPDGLGRKDIFRANPTKAEVYVQDDIEYKGFVSNVGLRGDFWFPGKLAERAALAAIDGTAGDLFSPAVGEQYFDETSSLFGNRFKYTVSPRVAVSYPITDRDNLFFNYGHFSQWPTYYYVYTHVASGVEDLFGNLGNINLDPQITIQYELGARHTFTEGLAGDVTVFVKDIFNYPTSERFTVQYYDPVEGSKEATYFLYRNSDYARSRGVELSLRKRRGRYLSGSLNYTYSIATGRSSDPNAQRELYVGGATGEVELQEGFLWWNRPHRLSATFDFRVADAQGPELFGHHLPGQWGFNGYYSLSSGRAYTKEDITGQPISEDYAHNGPLEQSLNLKLQKWVLWGDYRIDFTLQGWNVFNWDQPRSVDPVTGEPYADGVGTYLNPPTDPDARLARYLSLADPSRLGSPRRFKLSVGVNF